MSRAVLYFGIMAAVLAAVGMIQSWQLSLTILNLCLISAVMALGVNVQWGVAGMFNVGAMGSAALGGLAVVLVSTPPVREAWAAGGGGILLAGVALAAGCVAAWMVWRAFKGRRARGLATGATAAAGLLIAYAFFNPARLAIEAVDAAKTGYLGGLGLPVALSWVFGGVIAALAAWPIGRLTAGLRSDYLAVATLGISEIVVAILRNEEWLARGVKNVTGLPRPVAMEGDLLEKAWALDWAARLNMPIRDFASVVVKLQYALWFTAVLLIVFFLLERLRRAPWGRMMRAIRDNEEAARAMGKDVARRHLQAFVLGSAIVGVGGAMLATLDGQFTPGSYQPLRYTFLIWLMVILGGSGNHLGAILGAFVIWFAWVQAETGGLFVAERLAAVLPDGSFRAAIEQSPAQLRFVVMGLILVLVMRFAPRGLLPEPMPEKPK